MADILQRAREAYKNAINSETIQLTIKELEDKIIKEASQGKTELIIPTFFGNIHKLSPNQTQIIISYFQKQGFQFIFEKGYDQRDPDTYRISGWS